MKTDIFLDGIVVSSRIRLARNLSNLPFTARLFDDSLAQGVVRDVSSCLYDIANISIKKLSQIDSLSLLCLLEEHKISKELIDNKDISAYVINKAEDIVVMINEEDHIRETCVKPGLALESAFLDICEFDKKITNNLDIAFDNQLGFLTACPSNLGTGMRASVMMFLPALTMNGAMKDIIKWAYAKGIAVRGYAGEGSKAEGYLYQVSNQSTLGKTENQIIVEISDLAKWLASQEDEAREMLFETHKTDVKDGAYRAFGLLANSYTMSLDEFWGLMAKVKLGQNWGLIDLKDEKILEKIEIEAQNGHIMKRYGKQTGESELDKLRADYLAKVLKNQRL